MKARLKYSLLLKMQIMVGIYVPYTLFDCMYVLRGIKNVRVCRSGSNHPSYSEVIWYHKSPYCVQSKRVIVRHDITFCLTQVSRCGSQGGCATCHGDRWRDGFGVLPTAWMPDAAAMYQKINTRNFALIRWYSPIISWGLSLCTGREMDVGSQSH